jgi:hypothetical protein
MKKDYVGYVLAIISIVIGALVSWHFYEKSVQTRSPALILDFFPATIYDAKRETSIPLRVLRSDGRKLEKSVHVARHVFWNHGNQAITANDVLTPIKVMIIDKDTEILSASISEISRKVTSCEVKQDSAKSFIISFRILEHDDGCSIKLFYSGNQYPKYDTSSDIVGVKKIELSSDTMNDIIERVKKQEFDISMYLRYIPRATVFIAFTICLVLYMKTRHLPKRRFYVMTIVILLFVGLVIYATDLLINRSMVIDRATPNTSNWISVQDSKVQ